MSEPRRRLLRCGTGPVGIVATGTILAILYFARDVLVPITLAVILSLLISPLVRALRQLGVGATSSVLGRGAGACAVVRRVRGGDRRAGGAHGGESPAIRTYDPAQIDEAE